MSGFGKYVCKNGEFYEGHFAYGKRHGEGRYVFKNQSAIEGKWVEGVHQKQ